MALEDIILEKLDRLDSVPAAFEAAMRQIQQEVFEEVVALFGNLEIKNGIITPTDANRELIERASAIINDRLFSGRYGEELVKYLTEIGIQATINDRYFGEIITDFAKKENYRVMLNRSVKDVAEVFSRDAVQAQFINPLKKLVREQVDMGADFSTTVRTLREYIQGNDEIDGTLERYVKQNARDAFAQTDRRYTEFIAQDLKLVHRVYRGGTVKDTREFCRERNGKVFHVDEIKKWAGLSWQGKYRYTDENNIFLVCGGYNCLHTLLPVEE